jgi:hypothetical protein
MRETLMLGNLAQSENIEIRAKIHKPIDMFNIRLEWALDPFFVCVNFSLGGFDGSNHAPMRDILEPTY